MSIFTIFLIFLFKMNFVMNGRKISKNKHLSVLYPIPNKNKTRFIFLFLISLFKIISSATILLTITGTGTQPILHESFNPIPSQIYVNDVLQDYTGKYVYNLEQEINYITLEWNSNIEIGSTHYMFYELTNIKGIDIIDFMMPNLVNTQAMFERCSNLETLNFYNFDTSKVLDMTNMFALCSSLVSLNLNSFDISQVTTFWYTFFRCSNLLYLNLNNFA